MRSKRRHLRLARALLAHNYILPHYKGGSMPSRNINVLNQPLQPCSGPGSAITGYTRTGMCEAHDDDKGSHHVCMNIQLKGDSRGENFCTATKQSNWCDTKGQCHGDKDKLCTRSNWCVCQWAYADVLGKLQNGCSDVEIKCDATSMRALESYDAPGASPAHAAAARCIREQCKPTAPPAQGG